MKVPNLLFKKIRPVIINQSSSHIKRLNTHSGNACCSSDYLSNLHQCSTYSKLKVYKIGNLSDSVDSSNQNRKKSYNSPVRLVVSKMISKQNHSKSYLTIQRLTPILNNSTCEHTLSILSSILTQLKTANLSPGNPGEDSNLINKYIPNKRVLGESTSDDI